MLVGNSVYPVPMDCLVFSFLVPRPLWARQHEHPVEFGDTPSIKQHYALLISSPVLKSLQRWVAVYRRCGGVVRTCSKTRQGARRLH